MSSNQLQMNSTEMRYICLGTCQVRSKVDEDSITSRFPDWNQESVVCSLGLLLDKEISVADHVNHFCRSCFYQLHQTRVIRHNLSFCAAVTIHSFNMTCLDYCNSILSGLSKFRVRQIQYALN